MTHFPIEIPAEQLSTFCQRWAITELALFGSILRPDFGPDSDVDVLVTFHPQSHPTLLDLTLMEDELSALLKRPVDLMSKRAIEKSPNYLRRQQILDSAQVIYAE